MFLGGAAAIALAATMSFPAAAATSQPAPATAAASANVLLRDWTGPYDGVPPWDQVKPELFPQAFQAGIDQLLAETDAIANNPEFPSFENTIEAMEKSGRTDCRRSTSESRRLRSRPTAPTRTGCCDCFAASTT